MRIISNFHDYYDSAMALGQDETVIYQRKTIEYKEIDKAPEVIKLLHKQVKLAKSEDHHDRWWWDTTGLPNTIFGKPNSFTVHSGNIVFCGKLYPYFSLSRDVVMGPTSSTHYFYDAKSMTEFCDANKLRIDERSGRWDKTLIKERIVKQFDKQYTLDAEWLIENKVICAGVWKNSVTINPSLKIRQFFKVLDAYSAFGALDMWICGTLAYPQNAMVELDDKSLIAKHGFDKWSFRKQPEGYKG